MCCKFCKPLFEWLVIKLNLNFDTTHVRLNARYSYFLNTFKCGTPLTKYAYNYNDFNFTLSTGYLLIKMVLTYLIKVHKSAHKSRVYCRSNINNKFSNFNTQLR